jgi:hypothetical protein
MFRVRGELPDLYNDADGRKLFFTEGQTQYLDEVTIKVTAILCRNGPI